MVINYFDGELVSWEGKNYCILKISKSHAADMFIY